jgi:hypothetical protein
MGHLVRALQGENIVEDLRRAYLVLARAYLHHRAGGIGNIDDADFWTLRDAVLESEKRVPLSAARAQCALIEADSERPGELFDQLGHMEVLLAAATELSSRELRPTICAPTQQSVDAERQGIPDLGGSDWFLEAYGGVAYANNGKLARDLHSLCLWSRTSLLCRLFLAFRESAWHRKAALSSDRFGRIAISCSKKHGGPFGVTAEGQLLLSSSGVNVVEVRNITIVQKTKDPPL